MSWLARSIAKTLLPSDDEEEEQEIPSSTTSDTAGDPQSPPKGVKEDISEITQTLTRQFRGFASFLAPPPQSQSEFKTSPGDGDDVEASDSSIKMPGIRSDFAEIGGRVRSGISKISEHVAVSEIAKIASSFLPLGSDEDEDAEDTGVVGVTEEVLMFVDNISMHPGTWLDFPLLEEECDDFEMSDVQQEHALAIEQLVPRLAALRIELCPNHMSERCFWKIYFMLVYPRLDEKDAEMLFSAQIMDARMQLSSKSQSQKNKEVQYDSSIVEVPILELPTFNVPQKTPEYITAPLEQGAEEPPSKDIYDIPSAASSSSSSSSSSKRQEEETLTTIPISDLVETEKHPVEVTEVKIVDKSVIKEEELPTKVPVAVQKVEHSEDSDGDDEWLQEDTNDNITGVSQNTASVPLVDDEDVSFSDLEDEDDKK
ncbi:BSD domain [Carex littledalei]|uniref:BSD domain n=1 Tax=Carex littledalei TaxID=544730 RepID=A0A833QQE0_9POAL|nr:BSD domain [Carex littledalei]